MTWKVSIYDFFLANTMHDFLYSICGTKCERFSSVQVQAYSESCYIHENKAAKIPPYRLMFIFSQHRRHGCHMAFSLLESMHGIISPASSLSSCCISHKTKAVQFPPYRLMFIFSNADGTTATWRFLYSNLYIESLRQRQAYSESCYIHEKQSGTVFTHTA